MRFTAVKPLASDNDANQSWQQLVQHQVGSLRFGIVQIVVHVGRVVQTKRTEKIRLEHADAQAAKCAADLAHQSTGGLK